MKSSISNVITVVMFLIATIYATSFNQLLAGTGNKAAMLEMSNYVKNKYPAQLTNPQKKNRKSLSQFGYGLSYFVIPVYNISEFIDPNDFGDHSFGEPSGGEHNGVLYTCNGGFIDFSHLRAGLDWSVYITFKLIEGIDSLNLEPEAGTLQLKFKNEDQLTLNDIASIGQKIAYERLIWHEIASWSYHPPNHFVSEQQSTFTPEDGYSNLLGTLIGKKVALRILTKKEDLPFSQIASEEIREMIRQLLPLQNEDGSKQAYDIVDRHMQAKIPKNQRNDDIWWDSKIIFTDQRYVFKRYMHTGPQLAPWLVPNSETLGCPCEPHQHNISVPTKTSTGQSIYNYYTFTIAPDSSLFFSKNNGSQLHKPFGTFTTNQIPQIVDHIGEEMKQILLPGFDKRDKIDPVPKYDKVKYVLF